MLKYRSKQNVQQHHDNYHKKVTNKQLLNPVRWIAPNADYHQRIPWIIDLPLMSKTHPGTIPSHYGPNELVPSLCTCYDNPTHNVYNTIPCDKADMNYITSRACDGLPYYSHYKENSHLNHNRKYSYSYCNPALQVPPISRKVDL